MLATAEMRLMAGMALGHDRDASMVRKDSLRHITPAGAGAATHRSAPPVGRARMAASGPSSPRAYWALERVFRALRTRPSPRQTTNSGPGAVGRLAPKPRA